eukprot:TRINITY_DN91561_c0_g1_i1.p2 TRINITY_DN91561_c0_g1~~TRINITY_DN91561_c0_g1_i1.p2  ORF type:complete len:294 (+),score=63.94 TRINITY_DN91561_c0_g1_i1:67-948(+)
MAVVSARADGEESATNGATSQTADNAKATNSNANPTCTPLSLFIKRRRASAAAEGSPPPGLVALQAEWRRLPAEERASFEAETKALRQASQANDVAALLKKQLVAHETKPRVRPLDLAAEDKKAAAKRGRKASAKDTLQVCQVPLPPERFPERRLGNAAETDSTDMVQRSERRKEIATMLKSQVESCEERMAASSSRGVDILEAAAALSGPSLSCDWRQETCSDNEEEEGELLEVDLPLAGASNVASKTRHGLLRQELSRRISVEQVQKLASGKPASRAAVGEAACMMNALGS